MTNAVRNITVEKVIIFLSGGIVIFNLYCIAWFPPSPFVQRGIFMSTFIILATLTNPPKSKLGKIAMIPFVLMALLGSSYPVFFADEIVANQYMAEMRDVYIFVIFLIGIAPIIVRMSGGPVIFGMVIAMFLYIFFGHQIPGLFGHPPLPIKFIVSLLYTDTNQGVFGFYADVGCRLISIFMMFSALLLSSGLGDVFMALATRLTGNAVGGPAKVSVVSSGFFGMLSGSAVSNVAATGAFSIPLMKKLGYSPSMAATVEAIASSGGSLMPPIMASAAFIMAELLGISYFRVIIVAIVPAFLWYFSCFLIVHYYAKANKLARWRPPKEEVVSVVKAKGHLLFTVVILVGALVYFATPQQAAFWAVVSLLIIGNLKKATRLNKENLVGFLMQYTRMCAPIFVMLIALGVFVAAMLGTGVHTKIGLMLFAGIEQWYVILIIAAALITVLGMAVPLSASYLSGVMILAPLLCGLGYIPIVVHFFVFYIACLAPITPPVCMATFTAARIAGSNMLKTGVLATLKALPLWIFPFALFRKALYFAVGTPLNVLCIGVGILVLGGFIFILGAEGYFCRKLKSYERILAIIIGLMMAQPISDFCSWVFSGCGVLLITYWLISHRFEKSRLMHD